MYKEFVRDFYAAGKAAVEGGTLAGALKKAESIKIQPINKEDAEICANDLERGMRVIVEAMVETKLSAKDAFTVLLAGLKQECAATLEQAESGEEMTDLDGRQLRLLASLCMLLSGFVETLKLLRSKLMEGCSEENWENATAHAKKLLDLEHKVKANTQSILRSLSDEDWDQAEEV